jgi:hypothetical protein
MAFTTKEEFEAIVKEQYDNLDKAGFGKLMTDSQNKIKSLMQTGDIVLGKNPEDEDDYMITHTSNIYYEIAFNTFQFARRTKKLSFKQYKALSAFLKTSVKVDDTEFKQF